MGLGVAYLGLAMDVGIALLLRRHACQPSTAMRLSLGERVRFAGVGLFG
jgi:hypothetical protein